MTSATATRYSAVACPISISPPPPAPRQSTPCCIPPGPLLLNFGAPLALDIHPLTSRVSSLDAQYHGTWELPALGEAPAPGAVLIRPDGHVAWVGDSTCQGLDEALTTWCGPPPGAHTY
jgi:hypothetical protein